MYQPTERYEAQLELLYDTFVEKGLKKWLARRCATLIMQVELPLELVYMLPSPTQGEPLAVVPELLSGTPINYPTLTALTAEQRRALANARMLLSSYAGPYGWESALREYAEELPEEIATFRNYAIAPGNFDKQIIAACRTERYETDKMRSTALRDCLTQQLPYRLRKTKRVEEAGRYEFSIDADGPKLSVEFSEDDVVVGEATFDWFDVRVRPNRTPITVTFSQLRIAARFLDAREPEPYWENNLRQIKYLTHDGTALQIQEMIRIAGLHHVVGMVSSGKSTLMKLWATWLVICHEQQGDPFKRITIVLQDAASTIELANFFNRVFRTDPEKEWPVAVPLLGRGTRHRHVAQLLASQKYRESIARGEPHWGERAVNPTCLLHDKLVVQLENPLKPGSEPCANLKKAYSKKKRKRQPLTDRRPRHYCPLFAICPSQQNYRDMRQAQIWVTTAGAMGQGSLPGQLEKRYATIGDLVYEQSDLVVMDEVDTLLEWFDRLLAKQERLIAGGRGVLDRLDNSANPHWQKKRIQSNAVHSWIIAQRSFHQPVTNIVNLVARHVHLKQNVDRGYFTARGLLQRCGRRMLGLKEYDRSEDDPETKALIGTLIDVFERVVRERDPLYTERLPLFEGDVYSLCQLKQAIEKARGKDEKASAETIYHTQVKLAANELMNVMQSMMHGSSSRRITEQFGNWIVRLVPDIETRLDNLHQSLTESDETDDYWYLKKGLIDKNLRHLALRLQLAANAVLLDRHTRLVFYQWDNRPVEAIANEQPYVRLPQMLRTLLPLPPTGRLFGVYHVSEPRSAKNEEASSNLSTFAYTNIGRHYVTNFHRLRADLEGDYDADGVLQPLYGPNVLVMSGTSYLPDSTKWHFGEPDAIMQRVHTSAEPAIAAALSDDECWFAFRPMFDTNGKPIRVSGNRDKRNAIEQIARQLTTDIFGQHGYLGKELRDLRALAQHNPDFWHDRDRLLLLVNSYDQSEWVGTELRRAWPELYSQIYYLVHSEDKVGMAGGRKRDADEGQADGRFRRVDIEQFAKKGGRILVAPLQAIGRGFNILNNEQSDRRKAAFGAIFFLTRPMPHPHDTAAMAQEMNHRMGDWQADEMFEAWQIGASIYATGQARRKIARNYWREMESRKFYSQLIDEADIAGRRGNALPYRTGANPRRDLAATTLGRVIQAVGRLLRGDVPFHAYFIDAAWSPLRAEEMADATLRARREGDESAETSLLYAMVERLEAYAATDFGEPLYKLFAEKLAATKNLFD